MNELDITYPLSATLYATLRQASTGDVWNGADFVPWSDADIATYALPLTAFGGDYYAVDFPPEIAAAGIYRVIYYVQEGVAPAVTDNRLSTEELYWNGEAVTPPPPVLGEPVSPFFTYTEFLSRFGTKNVKRTSNKDADLAVVDLVAVQSSFNFARDEIYDTFRYGLYQVPFDWTPNAGIVPETVKRWGMNLAYGDLYEVRGWQDMTVQVAGQRNVPNKIYKLVNNTYSEMGMYRVGIKTLLAVRNTNAPLAISPLQPVRFREYWWYSPDQVPTFRPLER